MTRELDDHMLRAMRDAHEPSYLRMLRPVIASRGMTVPGVAELTGLSEKRVQALANRTYREEPWLSEAYILHRALGTAGIKPLMDNAQTLADSPMGVSFESDVDVFRQSDDVSLSHACRVAIRFGLSDPAQLVRDPLERQIWQVIERSERTDAVGFCPWCRAHAADPHLPTCLPNNLWGERQPTVLNPAMAPIPHKRGQRKTMSAIGFGIKRVRAALAMTQKQLGDPIRVGHSTIAQLERGSMNLTQKMAERLSSAHNGIPVAEWFRHDNDPACTVWPRSWGPRA